MNLRQTLHKPTKSCTAIMSESNTLTPAQEQLATISRGTPLSPRSIRAVSMTADKVRRPLRKTLQTDTEFKDKMRVYLLKTGGDGTFYDNRLHFETDEGFLMMVYVGRHCSGCGQMFIGDGSDTKLLSCAVCKNVNYCDKACQKRDWKHGHKSVCRPKTAKQGIEVVMNICIRALNIMRFFTEEEDEAGNLKKYMSENVMSSICLPKTDARLKTYVDLANDEWGTGGVFDRVCNHFREKQEPNRILCPIWETATDNLVFVPISLDFLSNGLDVPDTLVESFKTTMSADDGVYFVLVVGMVHGKLAIVGGNSFIVTPDTPQQLCQQAEGAKGST